MERLLLSTRFIVLIGVIGLVVAALAGFLLAVYETGQLVWYIITHLADPNLEVEEVNFIKLVDGFLVSTGLLIFGLGLYELFIRELELPRVLRFTTIGQLKTSLANIIVLTLAVTFLASLQEHEDAASVLLKGAAVAVVIVALVFFTRNDREPH